MTDRWWQQELENCRAYDADKRGEVFEQIADASVSARKQAHRSTDTAIRSNAEPSDLAMHEADIATAQALRRALEVLQGILFDMAGADTTLD